MSLRTLPGVVRNPGAYLGVLVMVALTVAAYQVRPSYAVVVGSPQDRGLLSGFHDPEFTPPDSGLPYSRFRWSAGGTSYVYFDGVGRQDFDAAITVNGSRPRGV